MAKETDISLRITNYDDTFTWKAISTAGEVIMDRIGNLSVVNLKKGDKATVTVTTSKAGYKTGTAIYNGVLGQTPTPTPSTSSAPSSGVTATAKASSSAKSTSTAYSIIKSGATCKKAGLTQVYSSRKFTCVKSGSKLIWNKGVAVKK